MSIFEILNYRGIVKVVMNAFIMETSETVRADIQEEKGFSVTASHLLEYLFCPRFTYFEYVLDIPQHEEKRFKVEVGRKIHE